MANAHRRRNNVDRIKINGAWCIEENEIREGIDNAFKVMLSSSGDWRPSISGLQLESLDQLDANTLESPFMEEEVFNALLSCNGDKAPGPDGLSMAFWQFAWDFVKADVLLGAEDLGDFRPISLVGSLYKWLAKVLANRLKKVVGKVISKAQGAFVEGRQILDAVLIANEAIDSTLKNNESAILCKLDIEKTYDNVDWTFILTVMQKMGFGEKWIRWIKWCISTASFSVLVNGTPTGFFQSSKGLRQGDPLSPYLFVIAMEVFSAFLQRAVEGGYLSGCRVKGRSEEGALISHLLFADDTLVFCKPSQDHLTHLSWLLMWFEAASGLRINLDKSELIPVGRVENMDDLAWEFGCKVGSFPSTYLGMPLGASFKSTSVWDGVEDRFRKRLGMWKRQYLSKGGRATLIRSTLSNLPIYLMSLLCLPSVVRRRLEKIQRDFLWGGGNLERKPHLVRWEVVCLSKKKGGLGVKNLSILNKALLAKWNWRFANEREALWNQVIRGKYGEERGGWSSREVREAHGLGLWKGIRMNWELVSNRLVFIVGNGRRVRFWRDKWCGDSPLCSSFPSLFALTNDKEESVANVWDSLAEGGWGDGILALVIEDVEDRVSWTKTKSGKFSVKSLYLAIEAGGSARFPSSLIWNVNVQPKISFFAWEATWGKALTLDKMQKRGWALANRCFLCLENEETIEHLLLHCSRTRVLWDLLFTILGVSWVLPCSVKETLLSWHGSFVGKKRKKMWRAAPLHIFWTVWKARNCLAFKDDMVSIQRLKYSFIFSLWAETKLFIIDCPLTIANFIDWMGAN
ncbi:putative ribonuclease H protein [Vitis vinifera]|uniref:Putative ribonuclease H protein n=1 Tax=Vitis vinifera TaxID=29760 RepID=A0A438FRI9_VITVI|nr:putative ribonuclease H protein [Vitis vinifera]